MDKKFGFYICTGCGIGKAINVEKLISEVPKSGGFSNCHTHPALCSEEGVGLIKKDIADNGVNTIVIGACSRRVFSTTFRFDGCITERVNLREQVAWVHPEGDKLEDGSDSPVPHVQLMAEDYLRMGMVKCQKISLPQPYKPETFSRRILVIGGGVTGMSAALDAAAMGYEVVIAEKQFALGGWAAKVRNQIPMEYPYGQLQKPIAGDLIAKVEANSKIAVKTGTVVARIAGQPGEFIVTFKKPGEKIEFDVPFPLPEEMKVDASGKELDAEAQHAAYLKYNEGRKDILTIDPNGEKFGAVILAAGWRPYKPAEGEFAELGFGENADVITNAVFEEMAAAGKLVRPSDGKPAKKVVFVQSPPGNDKDFPYASSVTSLVALKQAKYVTQDYDDGQAYIIYQHMRTPGLAEKFYEAVQQDPQVFLTKGEISEVAKKGAATRVSIKDTLLGGDVAIDADLVVLACGMVPVTADDPVVNLAYRQGPGFRDNNIFDQYCDSNFICFPYETQRTGIYAAGGIRRALTMADSIEDASGAALKAIQCLESVNRGVSVHPRYGDMTFPDFFFQRCTQCKRCTQECPFGAIDDDAKGTPKPNPTRCRRCGTCMGACPERIIGFADYSIDSIGSQVKCIGVPSEDDYDEPPLRILVLCCENDAMPALDMAGMNRLKYNHQVRFVPVRCLGSVNVIWIKDALSQGMDGALLLGCKHGDDYQCHFVKGSELASIRMKKIGEALASLALEPERVAQKEIAIDEFYKVPELINTFVEEVEAMGPNPFKGF
ncbi:MAG: FAD-dependent oxidoreductase [Desulfatibacillaceae bacterium]|nr:FAD-dependent oxidoreductase [Desulfatibacillaceae bacterium]